MPWKESGRRLGAALAIAALLGGCETMGDGQRTQLEGAAGGAALGGLAGYLLGRDAKGAAIGTAVGAALGYGVGTALANRKQQYANAEDFYDAQIAQTQSTNLRLARYNGDLSRQVARYQAEIATLEARAQRGAVDRGEARRAYAEVEASHSASARALNGAKEELRIQQQVAQELRQQVGSQAGRTRQANEEVAELTQHVGVLQQQVETLASQGSQLEQFN